VVLGSLFDGLFDGLLHNFLYSAPFMFLFLLFRISGHVLAQLFIHLTLSLFLLALS